MIIKHLIERIPIKPTFTKLMVVSVVTALVISLGMDGILWMFNFSVSPAIPATFGAIGAAIFAARMRS